MFSLPLFMSALVLAVGIVAYWYFVTIRFANVETIEASNDARLIIYPIDHPNRLEVLGPGTYTLPMTKKSLLTVRTTPIQLKDQQERFDTHNIPMDWKFEYEWWIARSENPHSEVVDEEYLNQSVLKAYRKYGNPHSQGGDENTWQSTIHRTVRLELEKVGRLFEPSELYDPENHPITLYIDELNIIQEAISQHELPRLLCPRGHTKVRVDRDKELFDALNKHVVAAVNMQHRDQHGLELRPTKFSIINVEYSDERMRTAAQAKHKAELQKESVDAYMKPNSNGVRAAEAPQEAMTLTVGEEDQYPGLVKHTRWQNVAESVTDKILERLDKFLERKE